MICGILSNLTGPIFQKNVLRLYGVFIKVLQEFKEQMAYGTSLNLMEHSFAKNGLGR